MSGISPQEKQPLPAWVYAAFFSAGHFSLDFHAAMITPLAPEFQKAFKMQEWQILLCITPVSIVGSFLQPVLGLTADRFNRGALAAFALLLASVFMSLSGLAPNPAVFMVLLLLGGLGVGLFHPASASALGRTVSSRSNLLMSIFVVCGMVGQSVAGPIMPWVVEHNGAVDLSRTFLVMPVGLAIGALLLIFTTSAPGAKRAESSEGRGTLRGIFSDFFVNPSFGSIRLLWGIALLRTTVLIVFLRLTPFLAEDRLWGPKTGGLALGVILFSLGLGSLLGGWAFEHSRPKSLFLISTLPGLPCFVAYALWSPAESMIFAGLGAMFVGLAAPRTITLAQELQPTKAGLVSGLMMGFAWGMAELIVPLVSGMGEITGRPAALICVAFLLVPASVMVRWLAK